MHSGVWGLPSVASRAVIIASMPSTCPGHGFSAPASRVHDRTPLSLRSMPLSPPRHRHSTSSAGRWAVRLRSRGRCANPQRVARLALVATTPRFVAGDGWDHAISSETLQRFGDELAVAWKATVLRFLTLQLRGSEHGRAALGGASRRALRARRAVAAHARGGACRTRRRRICAPRSAAFAIPRWSSRAIGIRWCRAAAGAWLASAMANGRFVSIDGAAHVPFLSHPDEFVTHASRISLGGQDSAVRCQSHRKHGRRADDR